MKKSELRYIIGDYCSQYEIEINDEQLDQATEALGEEVDFWEELNYRCGIHSLNIDPLLDRYFEEW